MSDQSLLTEDLAQVFDGWNASKPLFTAGPASLVAENALALRPCFGRGDAEYLDSLSAVLSAISELAEQSTTVAMQGSGTSAIEVMIANFVYGSVLIVDSGYYAKRLYTIAKSRARRDSHISGIEVASWHDIDDLTQPFDWVLAVYTETSEATLVPINRLDNLVKRCGAKLALDATASIGLESDHGVADVCAFSSCKGLFGLTGAGFISFSSPPQNEVEDMIAALSTYAEKKTTGPYHAVQSLSRILPRHREFRSSVVTNKLVFLDRFRDHLIYPSDLQPLLCTALSVPLVAKDKNAILYMPRQTSAASITCHIGEVHLGLRAKGKIIDTLEVVE
ncbi:MAG: hypothetical protein AAFR98_07270 [Pseudomonadota bacterium]